MYDIGCGLGRWVCWYATKPIQKSVGIGFREEFVAIARAQRQDAQRTDRADRDPGQGRRRPSTTPKGRSSSSITRLEHRRCRPCWRGSKSHSPRVRAGSGSPTSIRSMRTCCKIAVGCAALRGGESRASLVPARASGRTRADRAARGRPLARRSAEGPSTATQNSSSRRALMEHGVGHSGYERRQRSRDEVVDAGAIGRRTAANDRRCVPVPRRTGSTLYIGRASDLRHRVASYWSDLGQASRPEVSPVDRHEGCPTAPNPQPGFSATTIVNRLKVNSSATRSPARSQRSRSSAAVSIRLPQVSSNHCATAENRLGIVRRATSVSG